MPIRPTAAPGWNRASVKIAALLAAMALPVGCADLRGEPVEIGFVDAGTDDRASSIRFVTEAPIDNRLAAYDTVPVSASNPQLALFDFGATDLMTGADVEGVELLDNAGTMIGFYSPSCPICREEGPKLSRSAILNPDLDYWIIHTGGDEETYLDYIAETDLDQPNIRHLIDRDNALWIHFNILAQPSYVLVGADGRASRSTGALEDHGLERAAGMLSDGQVLAG